MLSTASKSEERALVSESMTKRRKEAFAYKGNDKK